MSNCNYEINENTIKTWKKEELPKIISGLPESKQLYTIIVISNYFNENKENKKKDEEDISLFKYILELLLSEYTKKIEINSSDEEVKKLFKWHNRSIHFVKTFIETVEGKWKEQKEELENNEPKKKGGLVAQVLNEAKQFFPLYLPIITLFETALNKLGDQAFHTCRCQELLEKLECLYKNWREALVKCAVDILYTYEEYLFKAKRKSDVKKIAKIAAYRVLEYSPKNEEDLNSDECYKELLKTLLSAKGKGLKATLVEGDDVKAKFCFNEIRELKIDDIFARAPVYLPGMGYRRVTKQPWYIPGKWKFSKWNYGCKRKFKCAEVEVLNDNESNFSDNCINYCFNENVACYYLWQCNIDDENCFLSLCKKYSPCVKKSNDVLKEDIDLLQNLPTLNEDIRKLMQGCFDNGIFENKVDVSTENDEKAVQDANISEFSRQNSVATGGDNQDSNSNNSNVYQSHSQDKKAVQVENISEFSRQNSAATGGDNQDSNSNNSNVYQSHLQDIKAEEDKNISCSSSQILLATGVDNQDSNSNNSNVYQSHLQAKVSTQEENIRGYSRQNSFATGRDKQELNSSNYDEYQSQINAKVSTQEENIRGYSRQNSFVTGRDKQELNSSNYDEYQSQTNGSGIVDFNLNMQRKEILKSPLKEFRLGFGDLKKILDNGDYVLKIAAYINIEDEDRKTIIFTDHGGGNHALFFLELLKWDQPNLTIELLQKCLHNHHCIEAENVLTRYNSKEMFQRVSHKDVMDLSFKLVPPTELNVAIWKDLAADLGISSADVLKIENMGRRPAKYSRTEKLFQIISMRFPKFTIGNFLKKLEELKLYDALELMDEKINEKIACT